MRIMYCKCLEEGEVIEDNMIVEFKYDVDDNYMWRWKPLRVRYDKTAQLEMVYQIMETHTMLQIVIGIQYIIQ